MRPLVLSFAFSLTLATPMIADGQQAVPVWFSTDFDGEARRPYADAQAELQAMWAGDGWQLNGTGSVSPTTDDLGGGFGAPTDSYENFLLTGDDTWTDVVVETVVTSRDDDAVGIVARYSGAGSYYACLMTRDRWPSCDGRGRGAAPVLGLMRVDTDVACEDDYVVAAAPGDGLLEPGRPYLMHLEVIGGRIACAVDMDGDGAFDNEDDLVIGGEDPDPLPGGMAGIAALDSRDTRFTSLIIGGLGRDDVNQDPPDVEPEPEPDPEGDPQPAPVPDRDGDGLADAIEGVLGSDPDNPDTDADGLVDGIEPDGGADTDGDGLLNVLDPDSDDDGVLDGVEDANHNGLVDEGETDPLVADQDPAPADPVPEADPAPGPDPEPVADPTPEPEATEVDASRSDASQPATPATPATPRADPSPTPAAPPAADPGPAPAQVPRRAPAEAGAEDAEPMPEGELFVAGGGCSQTGGSTGGAWVLVLLAVLGFVARRRSPAVVALLLVPAMAHALPAERFRMASNADGLLDVESGGVAPGTAISAGLWLGRSANSMVLMRRTPDGAVERVGALVGDRLAGTLSAGLAVAGRASVELRAPILLSQTRADVDAIGVSGGLQSSGMGDLEIAPKLRLLDAGDFGVDLAVLAGVTMPTGDTAAFWGEDGPTLSPEVAVSRRHGRLRWAANLGGRLRKAARIGDQNIGSELVARVGGGVMWTLAGRPFELGATTAFAAPADAAPASELFAGVTAGVIDGLQAFVGAGTGMGNGLGAPDHRVALGLRYTHRPSASSGGGDASALRRAPAAAPPPPTANDEDILMDDPLDDLFADDPPASETPAAIEFAPDDLGAD